MRGSSLSIVLAGICVLLVGGGWALSSQQRATPTPLGASSPTIVIHITSGPDDLFGVMNGLHMAEDARNLGRRVIIMFSKAGARVPMVNTGWELRMGEQPPVRDILIELQDRGVDLIVCDFSATTLGIRDAEFINGTFIANTNETLLKRMGGNATVFTF